MLLQDLSLHVSRLVDSGHTPLSVCATLVAEFAHPGLDHLNLFQNVKETVLAATGGAQQPWERERVYR
jgi:hypothetical protein